MPIDFPNSPAPNEIFTVDGRSWKWNTVYWEAIATSGPTGPTGPEGNFNVSPTAPSSPSEGDVWYDSDTGQMFVRYDDYWVESSAAVGGPTGPAGVTQSTSAPSDTTVLWIDTDEPGDAVIPTGGTTGQALVKASNSEYDTAWSSNFAISPNYIINGAFDIWQRGTTFSNPATNAYFADRIRYDRNGSGGTYTISQQKFTPAELQALGYGEAENYLRVEFTGAPTGQTFHNLTLRIEDVRTLAGQTATLSWWAKS